MSSISADYTLTFEEFAGAYRLQRRRRRFLSGPPERSRWYGCAWMAGLFVVLLIAAGVAMAVTGHQTIDASGRARTESDSPIFMFLVGLLPWPPLIGVLWLLLARSVFDRRTLSRMMVLFMVIGAGISAFGTFSERAAATGTRPAPSEASWLSLAPLLGLFVALCFFYFFILRRTVRVAWDGQPQLRRSIHFEADADRVIVQTPVTRTEYAWEAVVSFSESADLFLLSLSALTFQVVPKRALDGPRIEALRELLRAKSVDAEGTAAHGFPVAALPAERAEG